MAPQDYNSYAKIYEASLLKQKSLNNSDAQDDCDELREKINSYLRKYNLSKSYIIKAFKIYDDRVSEYYFDRFMSLHGAQAGNNNPVYYPASVFFEDLSPQSAGYEFSNKYKIAMKEKLVEKMTVSPCRKREMNSIEMRFEEVYLEEKMRKQQSLTASSNVSPISPVSPASSPRHPVIASSLEDEAAISANFKIDFSKFRELLKREEEVEEVKGKALPGMREGRREREEKADKEEEVREEERDEEEGEGEGEQKKLFIQAKRGNSLPKQISKKQLLNFIKKFFDAKGFSDYRSREHHQPRETAQEFLRTYLTTKYGVRRLVSDISFLYLQASHEFADSEPFALLFIRILNNEIDEEFRHLLMQQRDAIFDLYRSQLRTLHPFCDETAIDNILRNITASHEIFTPCSQWIEIIRFMYNANDAEIAIHKLMRHVKKVPRENLTPDEPIFDGEKISRGANVRIDKKEFYKEKFLPQQKRNPLERKPWVPANAQEIRRDSRREHERGRGEGREERDFSPSRADGVSRYFDGILFSNALRVLQLYQIESHQKFISPIKSKFDAIDTSKVGYLSLPQFRNLITNFFDDFYPEDISLREQLLTKHQQTKYTFSDCVLIVSPFLIHIRMKK